MQLLEKNVEVRAGSFNWSLVQQSDEGKSTSPVPVASKWFTVGRQESSSLPLASKHVSTRHAVLIVRDELLWVIDLDSSNGTLVNGAPVSHVVRLANGDVVQFADVAFRIENDTAPPTDRDCSDTHACHETTMDDTTPRNGCWVG